MQPKWKTLQSIDFDYSRFDGMLSCIILFVDETFCRVSQQLNTFFFRKLSSYRSKILTQTDLRVKVSVKVMKEEDIVIPLMKTIPVF